MWRGRRAEGTGGELSALAKAMLCGKSQMSIYVSIWALSKYALEQKL